MWRDTFRAMLSSLTSPRVWNTAADSVRRKRDGMDAAQLSGVDRLHWKGEYGAALRAVLASRRVVSTTARREGCRCQRFG